MRIDVNTEAKRLWQTLGTWQTEITSEMFVTRGLGGRSHGKAFKPTELRHDRIYLQVEGRSGTPKRAPFIKVSDLEIYLKFERREITMIDAKKSFVTSYAGPLIERLRTYDS